MRFRVDDGSAGQRKVQVEASFDLKGSEKSYCLFIVVVVVFVVVVVVVAVIVIVVVVVFVVVAVVVVSGFVTMDEFCCDVTSETVLVTKSCNGSNPRLTETLAQSQVMRCTVHRVFPSY